MNNVILSRLQGKKVTRPAWSLDITNLSYAQTWNLMKKLVQARINGRILDTVLLLEHEEVITLGRRSRENELFISREELASRGINVFTVERGGLATCHGPGQLVIYIIFYLPGLGLGVAETIYKLEEVILKFLAIFGIVAIRRQGVPGIWIDEEKIAFIGLAIKRGVTFHGLALNCAQVPSIFDLVKPCGESRLRLTCLNRVLDCSVNQMLLRQLLLQEMANQFVLNFFSWSVGAAQYVVNGLLD